ncbi:hypothetical protein Trydic_g5893 [Trypoxylus dichotomus]
MFDREDAVAWGILGNEEREEDPPEINNLFMLGYASSDRGEHIRNVRKSPVPFFYALSTIFLLRTLAPTRYFEKYTCVISCYCITGEIVQNPLLLTAIDLSPAGSRLRGYQHQSNFSPNLNKGSYARLMLTAPQKFSVALCFRDDVPLSFPDRLQSLFKARVVSRRAPGMSTTPSHGGQFCNNVGRTSSVSDTRQRGRPWQPLADPRKVALLDDFMSTLIVMKGTEEICKRQETETEWYT